MNRTKNNQIYERAINSIPGGLFSNFKKEKGVAPVYIRKAEGARLMDFDDNIYYDFSLSAGPDILGHSNEHLKIALAKQIGELYTNEYCLIQIEAAEKIIEHVPAADLVRFSVSGAEAVYNSVRLARCYTGKKKLVKFKGQYHGGMDYILGGMVKDAVNPVVSDGIDPEDIYTETCFTKGRAEHALIDSYMIEWNDLDELEYLMKRKDDIAAVILEPVTLNLTGCTPEPGYLAGVRELCTKYGIVLIFDETLTGFRMGLGGAQAVYGVTPDLCILAKAVGGGVPAAVFCGKREVMDKITNNEVLAVGTYNGHPLACAAIVATITELEKNSGEAFCHIERLGTRLKEGFIAAAQKHGIPMIMQGFPGALVPVFTEKERIVNHRDALQHSNFKRQALFLGLIKQRGILHNGRLCTSAAHTDADIDYAIAQADSALARMASE